MRTKVTPQNNSILITGISGFVGSTVARYFKSQRCQVFGISRNQLTGLEYPVYPCSFSPIDISKLLNNLRPEVIFHAAGSSSVGSSLQNPAEDYHHSVALFQSLLEGVRLSKERPLVVYPSSASVYGNPASLPIPETARRGPISPYGYHKEMCELLAEEYHSIFEVPSLVARIFSLFGSGQKRLLIWELFNQFKNNTEVVVEGTGKEARDYLHIDDFVKYLYQTIEAVRDNFTILNIASGQSITVSEIAHKIRIFMNSSKSISFQSILRPGNPNQWRADISKLQQLVGSILHNFDAKLKLCIEQWENAC